MAAIVANVAIGIVGGYLIGLLVTFTCGRGMDGRYRWRQDRSYHIAMAVLFAVMGAADAAFRAVF